MIIDRVTITGADNDTDPQCLIDITKKFPFVEWGVLFSKQRTNTPRYPNKYYGYTLKKLGLDQGLDMKLSAHICGNWTKEFFKGNFTFESNFLPLQFEDIFERIQLNFNSKYNDFDINKVLEIIELNYVDFIFQYNESNSELCNKVKDKFENINFLYDSSGGRGIERNKWPSPIKHHFTGYAGGLTPGNIKEQLKLIEESCNKDDIIWIDVETGVRDDNDKLDLNKVEEFLKFVEIKIKQ